MLVFFFVTWSLAVLAISPKGQFSSFYLCFLGFEKFCEFSLSKNSLMFSDAVFRLQLMYQICYKIEREGEPDKERERDSRQSWTLPRFRSMPHVTSGRVCQLMQWAIGQRRDSALHLDIHKHVTHTYIRTRCCWALSKNARNTGETGLKWTSLCCPYTWWIAMIMLLGPTAIKVTLSRHKVHKSIKLKVI